MNTPHNLFVQTIKQTGHGSDWYGLCEVCKTHASSIDKLQKHRVWQKQSGEIYLSPIGGGAYGHAGCLIKTFGDALAESQFERKDGLRTVSEEQFNKIKQQAQLLDKHL
jgi:hypothetical protein